MRHKIVLIFFLSLSINFVRAEQTLDSLLGTAGNYYNAKAYDEALVAYNIALQLAQKQGDLDKQASVYSHLNQLYFKLGLYEEGIIAGNQELAIRLKIGNDTLVGPVYYNLGLNHKRIGNYDQSTAYFLMAMKVFSRTNQKMFLAKVYNSLGNMQHDLKHLSKAVEYHTSAIQIRKELNDTLGISESYHNLGQVYNDSVQYELARYYFNLSKSIHLEMGESTASNDSQIGLSYLLQEQFDSAKFYLFASLDIRKADHNPAKIATSYKHLGNLFLKMNQLDLSENYLDSAYTLAADLEINQELIEILILQIELEKRKFPNQTIYNKYEQLLHLNEIVLGENSRKEMVRLEIEMEVSKKDQALELQKAELILKEVQNEKLNFRNNTLLVGFIIVLFFVLLIGIIMLRLRKSKAETEQKNKLLNESNQLIDSLHKELSHRTKNYFQMFGGILKYDKNRIENPEVKQLLIEYIGRVEAMSQIQRYLLQVDTTSGKVQLDLYLSDLLSNIDLVLNNINPKVLLTQHFEVISCDYDIALRLGLVMNELVSNAFEHGFGEINHPELTIALTRQSDDHLLCLEIVDNGVGLITKNGLNNPLKGIGLMELILKSVKGKLEYQTETKQGTHFTVTIPE